MYRMIKTCILGYGYMIYMLPKLMRIRKKREYVDQTDFYQHIHLLTQRWAKFLLNLTGSTVKVEGIEKIPSGPVLLASNHQGNFDIPVILGYLPKEAGFLAKQEMKKVPFASLWMEAMGCVFINRTDRRGTVQALKESIEQLKSGHSLIVFPEGTRSKGTELGLFKSGVIRMASDASVPIVPISINGTYQIMEENKGKKFCSATIKVTVHDPVYIDSTNPQLKTEVEAIRATIEKGLKVL